jgi:hypothetical protein
MPVIPALEVQRKIMSSRLVWAMYNPVFKKKKKKAYKINIYIDTINAWYLYLLALPPILARVNDSLSCFQLIEAC